MKELKSITKLTDAFSSLPSIGKRTAEKLAYSILNMKDEQANQFANAILEVKSKVHACPICGAFTEDDKCEICSNPDRNHKQIIVVANPRDILPFEKINIYNGVYHILGGTLSATNGVGVSDLNINGLLKRIDENMVEEVILATNPTVDGETTALYLSKILQNKNVKVSRLAYGLPIGGQLEYADTLTLAKALEGRNKI